MQAIFYHNSSGELAFTESLKQREVHRAISLHPVKDHRHLYRLHAYFQVLIPFELNIMKVFIRDWLTFQYYFIVFTEFKDSRSDLRKCSFAARISSHLCLI